MNVARTVLRELFSVFVDDGALAVLAIAWVAVAWIALPALAGPLVGGVLLFGGLAAILAVSVLRA